LDVLLLIQSHDDDGEDSGGTGETTAADVAAIYKDMATVLALQEKPTEAVLMLEKELELQKQVLGSDHADVAESYNDLATAYANLGRNEEAYDLFEQALATWTKASHPKIAAAYNNMAAIRFSQERYDDAMALHDKSLQVKKKVLGPGHPYVAMSYRNMAEVLAHQEGKMEEAKKMYHKAHKVLINALGDEHPEVAALKAHKAMTLRGGASVTSTAAAAVAAAPAAVVEETAPATEPPLEVQLVFEGA
jgi:tetratricopeptide (TPR) repeat protein